MNCSFCDKTKDKDFLNSPFCIFEFKNSFLMVGEHQTFYGYCVLFLKEHIKEAFDLTPIMQNEINKELMQSSRAIRDAFLAEKINLSNYGNMTPHQHWHIFPRQKSDQTWPNPPWTLMDEFKKNKTGLTQAEEIKTKILNFLKP